MKAKTLIIFLAVLALGYYYYLGFKEMDFDVAQGETQQYEQGGVQVDLMSFSAERSQAWGTAQSGMWNDCKVTRFSEFVDTQEVKAIMRHDEVIYYLGENGMHYYWPVSLDCFVDRYELILNAHGDQLK